MLFRSLRQIARLKAGQGNPILDNFLPVGHRIMVVDFDSAYIMDREGPDREALLDASHVSRLYQGIDWD